MHLTLPTLLLGTLSASCSLVVPEAPDGAPAFIRLDDGAIQPAPDASDAAPGAPDATPTCDPYSGGGCSPGACYVGNDPLGGPYCLPEGSQAQCDPCNLSNHCAPGMFCTGYVTAAGVCAPLCDAEHPCLQGTCLGVQYMGYGFCQGTCL